MKTFTSKLLYVCVALLLCGCERSYLRESFVLTYKTIDGLGNVEIQKDAHNGLYVLLPQTIYASSSSYYVNDIIGERYEELSGKYGDVNFNRWVYEAQIRADSWAFPFYTFTVVSDADFDEEHPAGAPLDDVVDIKYYTYRLYIENGYRHTDERAWTSNDYSGDWVVKRLSDLAPEDAVFMDPTEPIGLSFVSTPTLNRQHHMTVTVWLETCQPYTFEFDMDFVAM